MMKQCFFEDYNGGRDCLQSTSWIWPTIYNACRPYTSIRLQTSTPWQPLTAKSALWPTIGHLQCSIWLEKETRTKRDVCSSHDRKPIGTSQDEERRHFRAKWQWQFKSFVGETLWDKVSSGQLLSSFSHWNWFATTSIMRLIPHRYYRFRISVVWNKI